MCSEFKRHLLHFSCIPHCQSSLPSVICMLKYCWHEYARKVNARPAPQIIADPFKMSKPLMRSFMQRLLRETDYDLLALFASNKSKRLQLLYENNHQWELQIDTCHCLVYFIWKKPCFTQHLEFLGCLVRSLELRHGDNGLSHLLCSWGRVADAASDSAKSADFFFGVPLEWTVLHIFHWKSQLTW